MSYSREDQRKESLPQLVLKFENDLKEDVEEDED